MALPPPAPDSAPPTPPPTAPPAEDPNANAPATPDGPVITLPAELIPDGLPDSGKMVISYTAVPDSKDGEMRAFVVTAVEPEEGDGEGSPGKDIPSVDDAFASAFPKTPPKAKKAAKPADGMNDM